MFVPVTVSVTVCGPDTAAEAVAVAVIEVSAASVPALRLTERLTVGKSLSVMVIFWVVVVPKVMPDEGLLMVNVAVSVPSTNTSFTTVKVTVPVVLLFGMVMVVLLKL